MQLNKEQNDFFLDLCETKHRAGFYQGLAIGTIAVTIVSLIITRIM